MKRALLLLVIAPATVFGQSGVQAVYRDGQTFVTFDEGANPPIFFDVYVSDAPVLLTANAIKVGNPFQDEWQGKLLKDGALELIGTTVNWRVPAQIGGYRNLGNTEGVFVNTVRSTGNRYYSVVPSGAAFILPSQQSAVVAETYDPVNEPVKPIFQFMRTINGFDNLVFATWRMGDDNPANDRPDFPVTANKSKNGMPHVFMLSQPEGGPGPGPYPLSVALHGGQGHWWQFRPGFYPNIGNRITSGLSLGPADDITTNYYGTQRHSMTKWFGWAENADATNPNYLVNPQAGSVVRNYSQRMLDWNIGYLLRPATGLDIDIERISMWGHSAGARGTSLYSRYRPEVLSAAYMYTPAYLVDAEDVPNYLFGDFATNLPTNLTVGGQPVRFWDSVSWEVKLKDGVRDIPFTKVYSGKMEFEEGVGPYNHWSASRVQLLHRANDSKLGFHLFWDSRDHGVPDWSDEDPGNTWVDVGEWIGATAPEHTLRDDIVDEERFRLHQSFPGFYDSDEDLLTAGRQPDPGNGDPFDGTAFGTWSGYIDWDETTLRDSPKVWSCTAWLTGLSPVAIDNYPGAALKVSMTIRRPQKFLLAPGKRFFWRTSNAATGATLQSGVGTAAADGLVDIKNLILTKDPDRVRIDVAIAPAMLAHG